MKYPVCYEDIEIKKEVQSTAEEKRPISAADPIDDSTDDDGTRDGGEVDDGGKHTSNKVCVAEH